MGIGKYTIIKSSEGMHVWSPREKVDEARKKGHSAIRSFNRKKLAQDKQKAKEVKNAGIRPS